MVVLAFHEFDHTKYGNIFVGHKNRQKKKENYFLVSFLNIKFGRVKQIFYSYGLFAMKQYSRVMQPEGKNRRNTGKLPGNRK